MKIPEKAKRVFKGEIFEVYQWEQKMFDGTTSTFEMVKRPDTVQIIATKGDKIFMAQEEQPAHKREYGLLGGRVDEGEDPVACAKRELLEEAGMASDDWELFKVYEPVVKMQWQVYFYIARNCEKTSEPKLDSGERIEVREVTFEEFIQKMSYEYWGGETTADILRLQLDPEKLEEFKKKLFIS